MALNLTPIRTAIEEVLAGTIGSVRTVTANKFKKGAHSGRSSGAQRALALVNTRFETNFVSFEPHEATPISAKSSLRLDRLSLVIRFRYSFDAPIREDARTTVLDSVLNDGDEARQALTYPDNLKETNASVATNIVSGMLVQPRFEVVEEDWDNKLVVAELTAEAIANISQAVS